MLYVSDHGESLGENGLYLHGIPYAIAPQVQTHVPMITWLSAELAAATRVDQACLRARSAEKLSHDNLFHSMLGLLDVQTSVYRPERDLFAARRAARAGAWQHGDQRLRDHAQRESASRPACARLRCAMKSVVDACRQRRTREIAASLGAASHRDGPAGCSRSGSWRWTRRATTGYSRSMPMSISAMAWPPKSNCSSGVASTRAAYELRCS
jgi:hypothetical protein